MRKLLKLWIVLAAIVFAVCSPVSAQGVGFNLGLGPFVGPSGGYTGPGDIVASASAWGSCARVYTASLASTSTSLCDLVDSAAPTVTICTLRGSSTGYVDLTGTYCTGSVTPATKCAAATGAVCNIKKVYDQAGATGGWIQNTALAQPTLTFSALNSLPGMTCVAANNQTLSVASFTLAQPFSITAVYKRTGSTTVQSGILSQNLTTLGLYASNTANDAQFSAGTPVNLAGVNDNSFHAAQAVINNASSVMAVDGSNTGTVTTGSSAFSASVLRVCRGSATLDGIVMEVGIWSGAWNSTQYGNINTNAHSAASGYNF